jgi:PKD repeat protein
MIKSNFSKRLGFLVFCLAFTLTMCGAAAAAPTTTTHNNISTSVNQATTTPATITSSNINNINATDYQALIINSTVPFAENSGQMDSQVKYYADSVNSATYITNNGIYTGTTGANNTTQVIEEQFLDDNGNPITFHPTGEQLSNTKVNYYLGNNSNDWQNNLTTWNTIYLGELYPGVQVYLQDYEGYIEKIFQIAPRANPNNIRVRVRGASDNLTLASNGSLIIPTTNGDITSNTPQAKQENTPVKAQYHLINNNTYTYQTGNYNTNQPLTIDPTLNYSTYLGGNQDDYGNGIAVDANGNIYITGQTYSSNFPVTGNAYQPSINGTVNAFVSELNNKGQLIYSTYLGGNTSDDANGIAVDANGNIYITGYTSSSNFPVTNNAYQTSLNGTVNAFVSELNNNGQLIYSTYLGGNNGDGGSGIAVEANGNICITGYTGSSNFPVTSNAYQPSLNGQHNVFISELNNNGQLIYSTYLGGNGLSGDYGTGIAVDANGIYITGDTDSSDFPVTINAYQKILNGGGNAFVSELNNNGQLAYSTYLGGNQNDAGTGIAVDANDNIYITGSTSSSNFPATNNAYQIALIGKENAFVSELNNNRVLAYSTYLGGNKYDYGNGIAVDANDNIYITGDTSSSNFPVTSNAYQPSLNGGHNAFVSELNNNGQLLYSTYLGGNSDYANGIAVDANGNIYITGDTSSSNFPVTSNAYQPSLNGYVNAFAAEFTSVPAPVASFTATPTSGTAPLIVQFTDTSTNNPTSWSWDFGDGSGASTAQNPAHNYSTPGTYTVTLTATNSGGSNTITKSNYVTIYNPLKVISFNPANGTTNVPNTKVITINFSEPITPGSDYSNIKVKNSGGTSKQMTTSISGNVLTLTPVYNYLTGDKYTITIPANAVKDSAGNGLTADYTSSFTIATTTPSVTIIDPVNGAVNVPNNKVIKITFSEPITAGSAYNSITVKNSAGALKQMTSSMSGSVLTLTPVYNYLTGDKYTIFIPANAIKDSTGNGLSTDYTSSFTIATTVPSVASADPANNAVNVPNNKVIKITFSEPITAGSAYNSITVKNSAGAVKMMTSSISGSVLTLTPVYNYLTGYKYTVTIPANAVKDSLGSGLAAAFTNSFTIATTAPKVNGIDPVNGAVNVPNNKVIKITFSEPIAAGSAYNSITVKNSAGAAKLMTSSISGSVLTLTPVYNYLTGDKYTIFIPANAIKDSTGNGLAADYTSSFTIATKIPSVTIIDPTNNAVNVPNTKTIKITFNEPVTAGSAYNNIKVINSAGAAKQMTPSTSGNVLTLTPVYNYLTGDKYTITIPANAIKDATGSGLSADYTSSFTITTI